MRKDSSSRSAAKRSQTSTRRKVTSKAANQRTRAQKSERSVQPKPKPKPEPKFRAKTASRRFSSAVRAAPTASGTIDYTKVCFVIMPFGTKPVGKHKVNFDRVYENIFEPAINSVKLPEGGHLTARRADKDFFTASIDQEMFEYIFRARFALADITGLNANVMYEIGVRHTVHASGTAIFRQESGPIPFDINHMKAFPYAYRPDSNAAKARTLVARVLRESLVQNQLDSPVQTALRAQSAVPATEPLLHEAENKIRAFDRPGAIAKLRQAVALARNNPLLHQRLGLLLKDQGDLRAAAKEFETALTLDPNYGDAWREMGILQGKLVKGDGLTAEKALRRAIEIDPHDFDALASLGGLLRKNPERREEALGFYRKAVDVSGAHPYPLLMALKLEANTSGQLNLGAQTRAHLRQAELMRRAQAEASVPLDSPWCFFDLAELRLYAGDPPGFKRWLERGLERCEHRWQAETFRTALALLVEGGVELEGLEHGVATLDRALEGLS